MIFLSLVFGENSTLFSTVAVPITFPLVMYECSLSSTFLPAFVIGVLFDVSHTDRYEVSHIDRYEMISHCDFWFAFP